MQWNMIESKTFSSIIHPNDDTDASNNTHDNLLRITKFPLKTLSMRLIDFSLIIERNSEGWKVHHTQTMIRVGIFDSSCPKLKSRLRNEFRRIDIFSISLWRKTSFGRKFRDTRKIDIKWETAHNGGDFLQSTAREEREWDSNGKESLIGLRQQMCAREGGWEISGCKKKYKKKISGNTRLFAGV